MGPRSMIVSVGLSAVIGLGCGGGGGEQDLGPPETGRPDVIYQLPETSPWIDLGGSDDHQDPMQDEPKGDEAWTEVGPDDFQDTPRDESDTEPEDAPDGPGVPDPEPDAGTNDTPWNCEVDGNPCDDGDPCTENDRCTGGECRGIPITCMDDGIACTLDLCVEGHCVHPVKPAWCLIANKCHKDGNQSPTNQCLYCNAAENPTDWTPASGWTCSDGDPCTEGDRCEKGVCVSGVNTCFPPDCTYHADCYPERVCGLWYKDGKTHCSVPCTGPADCGTGEVCTHLPGSAGVGYCQVSPFPSGGAFGVACQASNQCGSTLCVLGVCGHFCGGESACPSDTATCFSAGDGATVVLGACTPNSVYPAGLPFGFACTKDAGQTYDSALCLSGHCDLMMTPQPRCARLCVTDSQCEAGQECNVILFSTQPVSGAIPFAPEFTAKTHDAVLGCYSIGTGGYKGVGQSCTVAQECRTNKCFALTPGNPTKYCTTFCGSDAQCPTGWQCKPELVTLTNDWLQQPFSQAPKPGGFALVRICKPK